MMQAAEISAALPETTRRSRRNRTWRISIGHSRQVWNGVAAPPKRILAYRRKSSII